MAEERKAAAAQKQAQTAEAVPLLDQMVQAWGATEPAQKKETEGIIRTFVNQVLEGAMVYAKDTESMVNARIAQLDALISAQLNEVMHAPEFQKLEASWRGLHYMVHQTETGTNMKIKVLNVSKQDLLRDLERAPEFDRSALFTKVYTEEYGVFGGSPFSMLVGDYEFTYSPQDVSLLEKIAGVAAASHAPFIAAAAPKLLGLESFTSIGDPRDVATIFESNDYVKWRSFRESDDARYVGLCLPHVLMRLPYGKDTTPVESFDFEEDVDGREHHKYLWGNAAYAFATRVTDAFARHGWCTAIRGAEGGGLVEGLHTHTFRTDAGDVALKCPTEIAIDERRDFELANQGFIPLIHCKGRDYAAFFSAQSANKPKKYTSDSANANARLSAQLQYMFAVSRFAHYLKVMMRDKVGAFMSRKNCEDFLNTWISHYVLLDDDAGQEKKAEFPLREARIEVEDIPGKPGAYRAVAYLRPHYQLEEIDVALKLVADLPEPLKG